MNRTFRLFISSTFDDYRNEREILNTEIYETINALCEKQGYHFEIVDLRWGVGSEASRNQKTVQICLDEVKKAQEGLRPSFLVMLGNRYGWIPLPYQIPADTWASLRPYISESDFELVSKWYEKDLNDCNEAFVLKRRTGKWIEDENWSAIESRLRLILQNAAAAALPYEEARQLCFLSATEREIDKAIELRDDFTESAIVCFRNPKDGLVDQDIERCRTKLTSKMLDAGHADQVFYFEETSDYLERFKTEVTTALETHILHEIQNLKKEKNAESSGNAVTDTLLKDFYGRQNELDHLRHYIKDDSSEIQFVVGDSGSGKTTLLCKICAEHENHFAHFITEEGDGSLLLDTLTRLAVKICRFYNLPIPQLRYHNAFTEFWKILDLAGKCSTDHKVLLVIDALDRYTDRALFRENLFDSQLPDNIKMIISVTTDVAEEVCGIHNTQLTIDKFNSFESQELLERYLTNMGRKLCAEHEKIVHNLLQDGASPIQIRILSEICKETYSFDKLDIGSIDEPYLIRNLLNHLHTVSGHSKSLIYYSMAFLSVAPEGLTENELRALLMTIPEVRKECFEREEQRRDYLPVIYWSRLSYELGECIQHLTVHGYRVIKFGHHIYSKVINEFFNNEINIAKKNELNYFDALDSYTASGKVNYRKAYSLLPLMIQNEESLENILTDPYTVQWLCESGQLEYVFGLWMEHAEEFQDRSVYDCLLNWYPAVNGYPAEFLNFYHLMLEDRNGTSFVSDGILPYNIYGITPFPYTEESACSFSAFASYYTILQKDCLYVHRTGTYQEISRIYLKENSRIHWYSENNFFITTLVNDGIDVISYEILDNKVLSLVEFHLDTNLKKLTDYDVIVSREDSTIIFIFKNDRMLYQIAEISEIETIVWNLEHDDIQKNQLLQVRTAYWCTKEHKLCVIGKKIQNLSGSMSHILIKDFPLASSWKIRNVQTIYDGRTLVIFDNQGILQALLIDQNNQREYIYPPSSQKIINIFSDGNCIWFIYPNRILLMDIKTKRITRTHTDESCSTAILVQNVIILRKDYTLDYNAPEDMAEENKAIYTSSEYTELVSDISSDNNYRGEVTLMAFSKDNKRAIAYENENVIDIYNDNTNERLLQITGRRKLTDIRFLEDNYVALEYEDTEKVLDLIEKRIVKKTNLTSKKTADIRYYNSENDEYIHIGDNHITFCGAETILFDLQNYDFEIIRNQLANRETASQTFYRERNDKNGFFKRYQNLILLIAPGLQSVLALDLNTRTINSVYYHPTQIVGATVRDDQTIWIGDSNGHITKLIYEPLGKIISQEAPPSPQRTARTFWQRHSKLIKKTAAAACLVLILCLAGLGIYNRPKYTNSIDGTYLCGTEIPVELIPRPEEAELVAYAYDYEVDMENIPTGIICEETNDFNQDGQDEILIIHTEKREKSLILIASMYRPANDRYEILDKQELGQYYLEGDYRIVNGAGEIFQFENEGLWTLGFCASYDRFSDYGALTDISFWQYNGEKFQALYQGQGTEDFSSYNVRSILSELDLDFHRVADSGWNLLSDVNEQLDVLTTIRLTLCPDAEWMAKTDPQMPESVIETGKLSFTEGKTDRKIETLEISDHTSFTYHNYNENISFLVTDFFDRASFTMDSNGSTIIAESPDYESGELSMQIYKFVYSGKDAIRDSYIRSIKNENIFPTESEIHLADYSYHTDIVSDCQYTYAWQVDTGIHSEIVTLKMNYNRELEDRVQTFVENVVNTLQINYEEDYSNEAKIEYKEKPDSTPIESYYQDFIQEEIQSYITLTGYEQYQLVRLQASKTPLLVVSNEYGFNIFWYNQDEKSLYFLANIAPAHALGYVPETDEIFIYVSDTGSGMNHDYAQYFQLTGNSLTQTHSIHRYEYWPWDPDNGTSSESVVEYYYLDEPFYYGYSDEKKIFISKEQYDQEMTSLKTTEFLPISDILAKEGIKEYYDPLHRLTLEAPERWSCRNNSISGWSAYEYELEDIRLDASFRHNLLSEDIPTPESEIKKFNELWGEPILINTLEDGFEIVWITSNFDDYKDYYYKRFWTEKDINISITFGYMPNAENSNFDLVKSEITNMLDSIVWDE